MKRRGRNDDDQQEPETPEPHPYPSGYRSPYGGFDARRSNTGGQEPARANGAQSITALSLVSPVVEPEVDQETQLHGWASDGPIKPSKSAKGRKPKRKKTPPTEPITDAKSCIAEQPPEAGIDAKVVDETPKQPIPEGLRRRRRKPNPQERIEVNEGPPPGGVVDHVAGGTRLVDDQMLAQMERELLELQAQEEAERKVARRRPGRKRRGDTGGITSDPVAEQESEPTIQEVREVVAPAWGWRIPEGGRASHVGQGREYQATTSQACGLFPFVAGSGSPSVGVPIGRHLLWGQTMSFDPIGWLNAGLTNNPGCFILGAPGTGKSALIKRLVRGCAGFGIRPLILGDLKNEYSQVVDRMGGQIIRIGHGLDRINPLDTGPLGQAAAAIPGQLGEQLRMESRSRRLNALIALLTLVRGYPLENGESNIIAAVVDLLDIEAGEDLSKQPTVPEVLTLLRDEDAIVGLMPDADVSDLAEFRRDTKQLKHTLNALCKGSLQGIFDDQTTSPIDLDAPGVSIDISAVGGGSDTLVAAAMLSTWAYGFSMIDGAAALAEAGLGARRQHVTILDELWNALRGSSGLVQHADSLTRLNRAKGVADIRATHSLADLEALATPQDVKKAKGFVERAAVVVLAGLPPSELDKVNEVVSLTEQEAQMVASWSATESWSPKAKHPGRGKYLFKAGEKTGVPVKMELVADEATLYDTDANMEQDRATLPAEDLLDLLSPLDDEMAGEVVS